MSARYCYYTYMATAYEHHLSTSIPPGHSGLATLVPSDYHHSSPFGQLSPSSSLLSSLHEAWRYLARPIPASWYEVSHPRDRVIGHGYTQLPDHSDHRIREPEPANYGDSETLRAGWILDRLFGPHHWCTAWVKTLCAADPAFFRHLSEQTASYVHFIALIQLAHMNAGTCSYKSAQSVARMLRCNTRNALLRQYFPQQSPARLLKVLDKLGQRPLTRNDYRRLIKVISNPSAQQFLSHARRIKPYHLKWLETFPHDLLHWQLLNSVKKASEYRQLHYICLAVKALEREDDWAQQRTSLRRLKTFSQLQHWFRRHLLSVSFPEPPWEGTEEIQPIRTMRDLQRAGRRFHNCIFEYGHAVLAHQRYFYITERGPVVIALLRDPLIGWYVEEINGIGNQSPAREVQDWLWQSLTEAGLRVHPLGDEAPCMDAAWEAPCDELYF